MRDRKGFTLIELSIVLVIIGLIVGGILVGRDLFEVARLKRLHSEMQEVILGVNAFKLKYGCLPGDCRKATQFFGTNGAACGAWNQNVAQPPIGICNGDGDGIIIGSDQNYSGPLQPSEGFFFWRMLKLSEMYPADITADSAWCRDWNCVGGHAGENVPRSKFSGNSIFFIANWMHWQNVPPGPGWPMSWGGLIMPNNYRNALIHGKAGGAVAGAGQGPGGVLNPNQAQWIDSKFDNGMSNTGKIIGTDYGYINCSPATSTEPVPYHVSDVPDRCGLVYLSPF
jgi:prepilin-type N-terminal cleavage/methylation domain-containing protein